MKTLPEYARQFDSDKNITYMMEVYYKTVDAIVKEVPRERFYQAALQNAENLMHRMLTLIPNCNMNSIKDYVVAKQFLIMWTELVEEYLGSEGQNQTAGGKSPLVQMTYLKVLKEYDKAKSLDFWETYIAMYQFTQEDMHEKSMLCYETDSDYYHDLNFLFDSTFNGIKIKGMLPNVYSTTFGCDQINYLEDAVIDFIVKLSGSYHAVLHMDKNIAYANQLTKDYAKLIHTMSSGRYLVPEVRAEGGVTNDKKALIEIDLKELPKKNISGMHLEYLYAAMNSPESMFLLFNNYRISEDTDKEHAFHLLLFAAAHQLNFIINHNELTDIYEEFDNSVIIDFIRTNILMKMEEIKEELLTIGQIKLSSMPFYSNFYYSSCAKGYITKAQMIKLMEYVKGSDLDCDDNKAFYDMVQAAADVIMSGKNRKVNSRFDVEVYITTEAVGILKPGILTSKDVQEFIQEYKQQSEDKDKYLDIYCSYYELANYLQTLYILTDVCYEDKYAVFGLRKLRDSLQAFIYNDENYGKAASLFEDRGTKSLQEREAKVFENTILEMTIRFQYALEYCNSIDDVFKNNFKSDFSKYIMNLGNNTILIEKIEELNNLLLTILEEKVKNQDNRNYIGKVSDLEAQFIEKRNLIHDKLQAYMGSDFSLIDFDHKFNVMLKCLATGEYLYDKYIVQENEQNMDFSCISLEYYTALEIGINIFLYIPYRNKILQPKYMIISSAGIFDQQMAGYLGDSQQKFVFDFKNGRMKESLEIGNLSCLYKSMYNNQGNIKPKFSHLASYLDHIGLDKHKVQDLAYDLHAISALRNEAAHGGHILQQKRAKKAQDLVYKHIPIPDSECMMQIADQCHNLVEQMCNLF